MTQSPSAVEQMKERAASIAAGALLKEDTKETTSAWNGACKYILECIRSLPTDLQSGVIDTETSKPASHAQLEPVAQVWPDLALAVEGETPLHDPDQVGRALRDFRAEIADLRNCDRSSGEEKLIRAMMFYEERFSALACHFLSAINPAPMSAAHGTQDLQAPMAKPASPVLTEELVEIAWAAMVGRDIAATCHQASVVRGDIETAVEAVPNYVVDTTAH